MLRVAYQIDFSRGERENKCGYFVTKKITFTSCIQKNYYNKQTHSKFYFL
jgi:hypothetical protein